MLGGTHGDEMVGIEVVNNLIDKFVPDRSNYYHKTNYFSGTLYLGFGNPKAIKQKVRGTGGPDLNRSFDPSELKSKPKLTDRNDLLRARELYPLLQSVDILIDIHNTHATSEPFICTGIFSENHKKIVSQIPVTKILIDPLNILSKDFERKTLGTTDSVVNNNNGVGIAYETGSKTDRSHINTIMYTILSILGIDKSKIYTNQKIYQLQTIIKSPISGKINYKNNNYIGWIPVFKGQELANIEKTLIISPMDGVLLFQKHQEKVIQGDSIGYIAVFEQDGN